MASLNGVQERYFLSKGVIGQVADDLPVAIRLKYISTGSVTSVTTTATTNIVTVTVESTGTVTKTYAFNAYITVGALANAINKDGLFDARVLDILRSGTTASSFANGAITISTDGYYDVLSDTSGANELSYCLSVDRFAGINTKLRPSHRVHLQEIVTNVTLGGGADANGLKVTARNLLSNIETVIYQKLPVTGSASTTNWASGQGKITGSEGYELVVSVVDASSVTGTLTVSGIVE